MNAASGPNIREPAFESLPAGKDGHVFVRKSKNPFRERRAAETELFIQRVRQEIAKGAQVALADLELQPQVLVFDEILGDRFREHGLVHDEGVGVHYRRGEVRHDGNATRKLHRRTSARQFHGIDQNPYAMTNPAKNTASPATKSRPAPGLSS